MIIQYSMWLQFIWKGDGGTDCKDFQNNNCNQTVIHLWRSYYLKQFFCTKRKKNRETTTVLSACLKLALELGCAFSYIAGTLHYPSALCQRFEGTSDKVGTYHTLKCSVMCPGHNGTHGPVRELPAWSVPTMCIKVPIPRQIGLCFMTYI